MHRLRRVALEEMPFHLLNRAMGRRTRLESDADYLEFIAVVIRYEEQYPDLVAGTVFTGRRS